MKKSSGQDRGTGSLQDSLKRAAERFTRSKPAKRGDIVFRLAGQGGGTFVVESSEKGIRVYESAAGGPDRAPLVEVIGDAKRVHAILDGKKDALDQFLAGGFRVRGDLRYLSDIALELGIIKDPL